jgi:hypothetical protein
MRGKSGSGGMGSVSETTPVQARLPIDAVGVGSIGPAKAWCVGLRCVLSRRVGVLRGRARPVVLWIGLLWKPSSWRHGAGSTPAAWDGLWCGAAGFVSACPATSCQG